MGFTESRRSRVLALNELAVHLSYRTSSAWTRELVDQQIEEGKTLGDFASFNVKEVIVGQRSGRDERDAVSMVVRVVTLRDMDKGEDCQFAWQFLSGILRVADLCSAEMGQNTLFL